jgi:glucosamine-6-phosphate deaminase
MKVIIAKNYDEMSNAAADIIKDLVNSQPNCILGLATGSTPIGMYKKLIDYNSNKSVDFSKVTTFNLDEYLGLPGTHPQSYRYFMNNNFFNHININKNHTHVPNGIAEDINAECLSYDTKISEAGGIDLQVLGIGNNGHIGFNEPSDTLHVGTHVTKLKGDTITANSRFFCSIADVPSSAVTMGVGGIMKARQILLLASGSSKAEIICKLVNGKINTQIPASLIQIHSNVTVIIDEAAGALLIKKNRQLGCLLSWAE